MPWHIVDLMLMQLVLQFGNMWDFQGAACEAYRIGAARGTGSRMVYAPPCEPPL